MSLSRGRTALVSGLLVAVVTVATACDRKETTSTPTTTSAAAPYFANWPHEADQFRFHWTAATGIDLSTGPSVAVRAYLESMRLAAFVGGDPDATYPGFLHATPENTKQATNTGDLYQLQYVRPKTRAEYESGGLKYIQRPVFGYQPTHILALDPVANGYRATVCIGAYSVYRTADDDPRKYFSTIADEKTGSLPYGDTEEIQIWRVELVENDPRALDAPATPTIPQTGPLPAPVDDVFGHWFITGSSGTGLWGPVGSSEQFDTPEVRQQCAAAMPDDAAARTAMATGFHTTPPPHGEAIPGWPAESK